MLYDPDPNDTAYISICGMIISLILVAMTGSLVVYNFIYSFFYYPISVKAHNVQHLG